MDSLIHWAQNSLKENGYHGIGPAYLLRTTPWSHVLRFATSQGYVFLKIMEKDFAGESFLLPFFECKGFSPVPSVIDIHPEKVCFLMKDAGLPLRTLLKEHFDISLCKQALSLYANLQIQCIVQDLLQGGIEDWQLSNLSASYKNFIKEESFLLSDGLEKKELLALKNLETPFQSLCEKLSKLGIPETLEQGDFHDNNILVQGKETTLHDFGDTTVSHPFFSLASFLSSLERHHGIHPENPNSISLRNTYLEQWKVYASFPVLEEAFRMASILNSFRCARNFARIYTCPHGKDFLNYKGYMRDALRLLIEKISSLKS